MVFENGVKNIQAAAYNGACTVLCHNCFIIESLDVIQIMVGDVNENY